MCFLPHSLHHNASHSMVARCSRWSTWKRKRRAASTKTMTCPQCTLALSRVGLVLEAEAPLAQGPHPYPPRRGQGQWVSARAMVMIPAIRSLAMLLGWWWEVGVGWNGGKGWGGGERCGSVALYVQRCRCSGGWCRDVFFFLFRRSHSKFPLLIRTHHPLPLLVVVVQSQQLSKRPTTPALTLMGGKQQMAGWGWDKGRILLCAVGFSISDPRQLAGVA